MPSVLVGAIFIPGTWFGYLFVRWLLTHVELNLADKVALSFLTALAYLVGHIVVAVNLKRRRQMPAQDKAPSEAASERSDEIDHDRFASRESR